MGCNSFQISHSQFGIPSWSPSIPPALDAFCMETLDETDSPIGSFCLDGVGGADVTSAKEGEVETKMNRNSLPDAVAGGA